MLLGEAKNYVREIYREFDLAGYYCQHWLLDASKMGVPQRRERVFFICLRKDLSKPFLYQQDMFTVNPKLELNFNEPEIIFENIYQKDDLGVQVISPAYQKYWHLRNENEYSMEQTTMRVDNVEKFFSVKYIHKHKVCNTILGSEKNILFDELRTLSKTELCLGGSYPLDYNFINNKPGYLVGMSVPPVAMAQIAKQVYEQWLSKIN